MNTLVSLSTTAARGQYAKAREQVTRCFPSSGRRADIVMLLVRFAMASCELLCLALEVWKFS